MRARTIGLLFLNAAWLLTAAGCTGGAPKTIVNKPIPKAAESAATDEPRVTPAPIATENATAAEEKSIPSADETTATPPQTTARLPQTSPPPERASDRRSPIIVPAEMPEVVLSAAHADDCLIHVGDKFPEFSLPDLMGRMRTLGDLRGDSLTVVVFWTGDRLLAADQLRYLDQHIARYADMGIKAVAINVGESPDRVRKTADELKVATPIMLDIDRGSFLRVGKDHLPRTYLIDGDGSVLWFDIEFSRQTRDGLEQAIHASLQST